MSLSSAQRARLGVFMIIGTLLLLGFIAIPIGFKFTERDKKYFATFEGESLSGLEQGAVVKYYGVPVGKVDRVTFDTEQIRKVRVEVRLRHDFPVKEGMYIQTGMLGITGLKYVEIMGGTDEAPLLKPGAEIPVKISLMASITGKADVLIGKIELLLNHITTFTHPDSLASVRDIFDNVAAATADVRAIISEARPQITSVTSSVQSTMDKVDSISGSIQRISSRIDQSVDPQRLAAIMQSIDAAVRSIQSLSENLDLTIRQTREDFTVSMKNLKETMESANELMKQLSENPSLLLKSEPQQKRTVR